MSDPQRALALVDIQLEYFSGPLEVRFPPVRDALAQITTAIDAATAAGTPIVVCTTTRDSGRPRNSRSG